MHRRLFIAAAASLLLPLPGFAAENDAEIRQKLAGTWVWNSYAASGERVDHEMTLVPPGDGTGDFAYSMADQSGHLVTQTGKWGYSDGLIGFNTLWSNTKDSNGMYLVLAPIHVVKVGDDFVETTLGIAKRKGT